MSTEQPTPAAPAAESLPDNFEALPLAKTPISDDLDGQYRVYSDDTQYRLIKATSALEALEISGLRSAKKIEREALYKNNLLKPKFLENAPAAAATEENTPPAPSPDGMPGAPLSNDAVDKLLNG